MSDLLIKSVEECKNTKGWDLMPHTLHFNLELLFSECELAQNNLSDLKQQLSNSISKDEVRGLVDEYEDDDLNARYPSEAYDAVRTLISRLNRLIEGGE